MSHATGLFDDLFAPGAIQQIFSEPARIQAMLDVEAALARAQARVGLIPATAASVIEAQCRAELFDIGMLAAGAASAGNSAIPLVKALTARVAQQDPNAAIHVHWGATSQDIMDTGLVLQLRHALDLIDTELGRLAESLANVAQAHRHTVLAGRTWLQQASPTTFGVKAAGWLSAAGRDRDRLRELRARVVVLQFGGAVGTLAALGPQGLEVAEALARDLKLAAPDLPWHANRDRVAEVATTLGLLVGNLGKIARDVSLLMQTEVGEAFEPSAPGRGGSSSMPHKQNPLSCAVMLAAATRVPGLVATMLAAMPQEHERGLGGWHAEWETWPQICLLAAGALHHANQLIAGLTLDPERMRVNLDATQGLLMAEPVALALAPHLGRAAAHELVERLCRGALKQARPLREVLAEAREVTAHLSASELDRLCNPGNHIGLTDALIDRALAHHKRRR